MIRTLPLNLLQTPSPVIYNPNCIEEKQHFTEKCSGTFLKLYILYGLLPLCIQAYLTDDELSYLGSKVKRKNLNLEKEGKLIESPEKVMPKEGFFCSWTKVHFILVIKIYY